MHNYKAHDVMLLLQMMLVAVNATLTKACIDVNHGVSLQLARSCCNPHVHSHKMSHNVLTKNIWVAT